MNWCTPISILRLRATRLNGPEIDIVERHVSASINKIVPEWALSLRDILNQDILRTVDCPRDGPRFPGSIPCYKIFSAAIIQHSEICWMPLTIPTAIVSTASVDVDSLTADDPRGICTLKCELYATCFPVIDI